MTLRDHPFVAAAAAVLLLTVSAASQAQVDVTTYHNDNSRTAQNTQETILTPANVNSAQFGKLFTIPVDGIVYAQPLYLSNVTVAGASHHVVYIATEHDTVYAADADSGQIYWQKSLIPAGGSSISSGADLNCSDVQTEVGITGTPVIDSSTGTLYVVAKVKLNNVISQHLHALDVSTGAEKLNGPITIQASVPGKATDGDGTMLSFNPKMENQRAALLLENGHIIISWASHCDLAPWHGWMMSYNASTLTQEGAYNASANGTDNGIWMSGGGAAADSNGNIFFSTGNGTWNGTSDLGDSIVRLGPAANGSFPVRDYFTPYNQDDLASLDEDLSAGGLTLLPTLASGQQLLAMIGKQGTLYLVDRNNMGKYCGTQPSCTSSDPNIVQEVTGAFRGYWGTPAYWNGNLYFGGGARQAANADPIKAYSFNANGSGLLSTKPTSVSSQVFLFNGLIPSVSANGNTNGIVWGLDNSSWRVGCSNGVNCQVLYAYDATNLADVLYTSAQAAGNRDMAGTAVKFVTPMIANGKVYAGNLNSVSVFGLLGSASPTAATPAFSPGTGTFTTAQSVTLSDTTPGAVIHYTIDGSSPSALSPTFTAALKISTTTTVKAIATANGFTVSPVGSATYTIASSGAVPVQVGLNTQFNVTAIVNDGMTVANGGADTSGDAYSGVLLTSPLVWSGSAFNVGSPGSPSGVSGGTLPLPQGTYTTLQLLATGVRGNQTNQTFTVTYTDGTTTKITQSLSDWFTPQGYPGESKAATMGYRLGQNGSPSANGPYYLYGYSFSLDPSKTLKSVSLPANRNVVVFAIDLIPGTATTPPPPSGTSPVSFSGVANVYGIFADGTPVKNGGMDGSNDAYSSKQLGASVKWSGTTFTLGGVAVADAISNTTVTLPSGSFGTLQLLATGVHGNQASQAFKVTYTDGTTTTFTQNLSDWHTTQAYTGESIAATMTYRLIANGSAQTEAFYLYGYAFSLNTAKTVKSLTLPANRNVVVLAATLLTSGGTTPPPPPPSNPTPISLSAAANVYGIGSDGKAVTHGGMDTFGDAYSGTLLNGSVTWSGTTFSLGAAGAADAASSATITLPAGGFSKLQLIASGVHGNQLNQNFVVNYTDGTSTTIEQSLSDWFSPQGYTGESTALTMAYRLTSSGAKGTGPFHLYGYSFAINSTKTVKSLTLPADRDVVVLAGELIP